jgi:hypothetical protein
MTILKMIQDEKKLMEKFDVKLPRKSFNRLDHENI